MKNWLAACFCPLPVPSYHSVRDSSDEDAAPPKSRASPTLLPRAFGAEGYELVGDVGKCQAMTHDVKLMRNKATGELVATKWIGRAPGTTVTKNVEREILNHRRLRHPNIIAFKECFATETELVIVQEYASGGCLADRIATCGPLEERFVRRLFAQLLSGMAYCHAQNVYHRDLRMENMLLEGPYTAPQLKISGWGYSKSVTIDSAPKTMVSLPEYSPPEALRGESLAFDGAKYDVWSCGIILYYMLTGALPFGSGAGLPAGRRLPAMARAIMTCTYELPERSMASAPARDLLARIFVPDPQARISVQDMLAHPWLANNAAPAKPPRSNSSRAASTAAAPAAGERPIADGAASRQQEVEDIKAVLARARQRRISRAGAAPEQQAAPGALSPPLRS